MGKNMETVTLLGDVMGYAGLVQGSIAPFPINHPVLTTSRDSHRGFWV